MDLLREKRVEKRKGRGEMLGMLLLGEATFLNFAGTNIIEFNKYAQFLQNVNFQSYFTEAVMSCQNRNRSIYKCQTINSQ